ncbi:uncharacterized protein LOC104582304 [Brachypodium distachyon]|uniref:uncharacterized protein LOC104582304 n=1 Tax=Brachypodium distachyon TaxID=15368 RepID=UPI00052FF229|nr:uncharacterized protein LOC104582304 [Brachypodium distachyon]|eukprot:XP_010230058.1 uncharacterized protein LOC104582304 [Brachypodium distachyon]
MTSHNWSNNESNDDFSVSDVEDVHGVPVHDEEASFNGVESDSEITCKHGKRPICRVASKGINTGRRFLACPNEKKDACRFVHWIDAEWEGNAERTIRYMWHKRTELSKELKRAEKEWNRVLSDNRVYEIEMNLNDKLRIREHDKVKGDASASYHTVRNASHRIFTVPGDLLLWFCIVMECYNCSRSHAEHVYNIVHSVRIVYIKSRM